MALQKAITNEQGFEFNYHRIDRVLTMFLKDEMIQNPENPDDPLAIPSGNKILQISIRMGSYKDQAARDNNVPAWKRSFSMDVAPESDTTWTGLYNMIKANISVFENAVDVLEEGQA